MYKFILPFATLLAFAPGCDAESSDEATERSAERESAAAPHASRMVGMLCFKLDCTDAQHDELLAIARDAAPDEDERALHRDALHTFAETFRADELDTGVLKDLHAQRVASRSSRREALVAAHGVLTSEQREELADTLESGFGPPPLMFLREAGPEKIADHMAGRVCRVAGCVDDQREHIASAIADAAPRPSEDDIAAMKAKVADAIRAERLDAKTLDALMAEVDAKRSEHGPKMLDALSEVHAILTPEQRDAVADRIEERGPRGLLGPGR